MTNLIIIISIVIIIIIGDPAAGEHREGEQERHHGAVCEDQEIRGGSQDWQWRGEKMKKKEQGDNFSQTCFYLLQQILNVDEQWTFILKSGENKSKPIPILMTQKQFPS